MTVEADVKPIDEMDKDELAEYALGEFGLVLDKRLKLADLREQMKKKMSGKSDDGKESKKAENPKNGDLGYVKHIKNKRIYPATELLLAMPDHVRCDAEGHPV